MVCKFVALFAFVACAYAGVLPAAPLSYHQPALAVAHAAPLAYSTQPILHKDEDNQYDPHPQYNYSYDIQDGLTGDFKNQHESRDGDVVKGQYSLLEADGTRRIVDYTADPVNGFNAVVSREGVAKTAQPALVKTVAAAPAIAYSHQPAYAVPAGAYHQPAIVKAYH